MTPKWRQYARFWGVRVDADIDDEMRFHMEMLIRDYESRGLSSAAALAAAAQRLGDLPGARDACLAIGYRRQRRMARARMIDAFVQDVRYAGRTLGRQRGWTTVALLTLALGIGASTAMFSVVNSLVLHPIAYVGADRVRLTWLSDEKSHILVSPDAEMKKAWRRAHSLDALEDFDTGLFTLTGRGDPRSIQVGRINSSFLALAGASMVKGRAFLPDEQRRGGEPVAMLNEGFWRDEFGASSSVLGARITVDGKPLTIVGIVSSKLKLPLGTNHVDVWAPLGNDTTDLLGPAIVRLKPGVTTAAAERELDSISARMGRTSIFETQHFQTKLVEANRLLGFRESLLLLSGAVGLLLIVACANVAHLMLARGATREREFAIRTALGAGRVRLARQLFTESMLLALIGCACGIALGYADLRALIALCPPSLDALRQTRLDGRALGVAMLLALATGLIFGITSTLHSVRNTAGDSLRGKSRNPRSARSEHRARSALVITEMALSAMLLVGAVLLVRSVRKLQQVDVHFNPADLYSMSVTLPPNRYPDQKANLKLIHEIADRVGHLPGVERAAIAKATPPDAGLMIGHTESADGKSLPEGTFSNFNAVAPEYFDLLGLRLLRGRTFSAGERGDDEIIINEGFARRLWGGEDPIGKRLRFTVGARTASKPWKVVVGVAPNIPAHGLSADAADPMYYVANQKSGIFGSVRVVVRTRPGVDPSSAMKRVVMGVDPRVPLPSVHSIANALSDSIASQRFMMELITVFAVVAVVLSAVGLYGVISYVVTQRTREIGIRMALGALPAEVARTVVARGLVLSVVGLSLGLIAAVWGTKLIKSALYGVTGTDATSYGMTGVALLTVSIVASYVPMRRAMRVDPVIAMRGD